MSRGYVKIWRSLADHPTWLDEPFTRGQAWVDLIMLANHAEGHIRVRGVRVTVARGQVGWSEVELAKRWKWSRGKVRRFLFSLEKTEQQIVQQKNNVCSLITLVNYDYWQGECPEGGTASGTANGQQTVHEQKEEEQKKNKTPHTPQGGYSASFEEFWSAYPKKTGKAAAYKAWKAVPKKSPARPPDIIAAIRAQVDADHFRGHDGALYIPNPATWLNRGQWEDEIASNPAPAQQRPQREAPLSAAERQARNRSRGAAMALHLIEKREAAAREEAQREQQAIGN